MMFTFLAIQIQDNLYLTQNAVPFEAELDLYDPPAAA